MFRKLALGVMALAFVFSCARKEKASDPALDAGASSNKMGEETVKSDPLSNDSKGSDSGKIEGLSTVRFDYDKSNLTEDSKSKLSKNADWIKSHKEFQIQIEGHCDQRGSIEYNLGLGERRAKAVKSYLVSLGVPAARMSTISYGKERPIAMGESEEAAAQNRRANFLPVQ